MLSFDNNKTSTSARSDMKCHYQNKYEKWYWSLIFKFEKREYLPENYDKHHPVPKAIWPKGWNHRETETIVCVTPREHFILHLLLCKCGFEWNGITRFVLGFARGKQKGVGFSGLCSFWKEAYCKKVVPHNKGKKSDPLWNESDYLYWVWSNLLVENTKGKGSGYPGNGYRSLAIATGVPATKTLRNMVTLFKQGWIPVAMI